VGGRARRGERVELRVVGLTLQQGHAHRGELCVGIDSNAVVNMSQQRQVEQWASEGRGHSEISKDELARPFRSVRNGIEYGLRLETKDPWRQLWWRGRRRRRWRWRWRLRRRNGALWRRGRRRWRRGRRRWRRRRRQRRKTKNITTITRELRNCVPGNAATLKTGQRVAGSCSNAYENVPAYRVERREVHAREGILCDEEVETHRG